MIMQKVQKKTTKYNNFAKSKQNVRQNFYKFFNYITTNSL